jgi:hypothetical protein
MAAIDFGSPKSDFVKQGGVFIKMDGNLSFKDKTNLLQDFV